MPRFVHAHDPLLNPPAEVLAEVDAAWERAQDPVADELELHFERVLSGVVRGELRAAGRRDRLAPVRLRGAGDRLR